MNKAEYRALAQRAAEARRAAPEFPGYLDEEWELVVVREELREAGHVPDVWAADIGECMTDMSVEEWEAQNIEYVEGPSHELGAIFNDDVPGR